MIKRRIAYRMPGLQETRVRNVELITLFIII